MGERGARAGPESWRNGVGESYLLVKPNPRDMDISKASESVCEMLELVFTLKEEILDDIRGLFLNLFMVAGHACT